MRPLHCWEHWLSRVVLFPGRAVVQLGALPPPSALFYLVLFPDTTLQLHPFFLPNSSFFLSSFFVLASKGGDLLVCLCVLSQLLGLPQLHPL